MPPDDPFNPYAPPKAPPNAPVADIDEIHPTERARAGWKTVAVFGTTARAVDALKTLETARIACRVINDGTAPADVSFHWVRSNPLGGHLVQVHSDDLAHAARILGVPLEADDAEATQVHPPDERMKKALLIAFVGLFACPVLAQIGSLAMIVGTPGHLLTHVGRGRRRWALLIDVVVLCSATFLALTAPPPTPLERARSLREHPDPGGLRR